MDTQFFRCTLRANPAFGDAAMSDRFRMTFANFGQYEVDGKAYVTDRDRPRGNDPQLEKVLRNDVKVAAV